jgi:hypothetical protein
MNWTLPLPLLAFAGVIALLPLAALARRPTSAPRLVVEAFLAALAVIALVWLAWAALWLVEQRW